MTLESLDEKVHNDDWDTLIILDACRYDYFAEFYDNYMNLADGDLSKVWSPGRATPETLINAFDGEYDWEVASAHPWINTRGRHISEEKTQDHLPSYYAGDHFENIHNIWYRSDGTNHGSTHPRAVVDYLTTNLDTFRNNKSLIWLIDPHEPHIGEMKVRTGSRNYFPWEQVSDESGAIDPTIQTLLRSSYKCAVLRVLYYVMVLVGLLDGKTVVSADHGELMFDGGDDRSWYQHHDKKDVPGLRHVPWLEVDSDAATNMRSIGNETFVKQAYQHILDRPADDAGLQNYTERLNKGWGRQHLMEEFIHSDEYCNKIGDPNAFGTFITESQSQPLDNSVEEQLRDLGYK